MENLADYLPLLNFVFVMVLIPVWNLAKSAVSSKAELAELKELNTKMTQELKILKLVLFQYLPDEAVKMYMQEQTKMDTSN